MIWKLLKKNISAWQIAGYALATVIGLSIVLCAMRFYADVRQSLSAADAGQDAAYMVVTRQSGSLLGSLGIGKGDASRTISAEDIADLKSQPWVEDVGAFEAANFGVSASITMHGQSLWTQLFLESVPDEFIDEIPDGWGFDPANPRAEVPIILPRDYLNLYNHGYASAHGMPQLSEDLISHILFDVYFTGNGHAESRKGRIAGFSDRINTIAAPQDFIDWANSRYSRTGKADPSRLIIKLSDPGNPEIASWLSRHRLAPSASALDRGKAAYLLRMVSSAVGAIGIAICALALFILCLSISLLLQKNKDKTRNLLLLGYSPSQISMCYVKLVIAINILVLACSSAIMLIAGHMWQKPLQTMGLATSGAAWPILAGASIMAVITAINAIGIFRFNKSAMANG